MKHTNYYEKYKEIRRQEVAELRKALQRFPAHTYEWNRARPTVMANPKQSFFAKAYDVVKVTKELQHDCGIFLEDEDGVVLETGYVYLAMGAIGLLLDNLPEVTETGENKTVDYYRLERHETVDYYKYPIASVSKEDLEILGFDTKAVTANIMVELAARMQAEYLQGSFIESLDAIATAMGLPSKKNRYIWKDR